MLTKENPVYLSRKIGSINHKDREIYETNEET
ncbi:hypothetical protein PCC7424_1310 [Gloeothece citriformis PCC 7424]|uniref:Uncharacterized protein n=1 Tax=Gloeothece citriformis (strain PCC 7424) TaxID=65393 RepID=B7K7I9_GLOC7|nr:hypothetical protein PCC7424_1310 [Gloeothece citriformis PCC 7424]